MRNRSAKLFLNTITLVIVMILFIFEFAFELYCTSDLFTLIHSSTFFGDDTKTFCNYKFCI